MSGGTVSGNWANNNEGEGIRIIDMFDGTVSGNWANNNGEGIVISTMSGGTVSGNWANNNEGEGIRIFDMFDGTVSGNTANNNGLGGDSLDGIRIDTMSGGTVSRNTANNNVGFGFRFGDESDTEIEGLISDNFANNNKLGGYIFDDPIRGTVTGNFATANGFSSNGSLLDSTANGFSLGTILGPIFDTSDPDVIVTPGGTFTNNVATKNANNGFSGLVDGSFTNVIGSTFSFNTANQNGDRGYIGATPADPTAFRNYGSYNVNGNNRYGTGGP